MKIKELFSIESEIKELQGWADYYEGKNKKEAKRLKKIIRNLKEGKNENFK